MRIIGNAGKAREVQAVASGVLPSGQPVVVNADGTVSVVGIIEASDSVGSPTSFGTGAVTYYEGNAAFDPSTGKILFAYGNPSNSQYGTAVIGTITGTAISWGSPIVFASEGVDYVVTTYDPDSEKVIIVWRGEGTPYFGRAVVATISGTSASFGSTANFGTWLIGDTTVTYDTSSNKAVIGYRDQNNSDYGTAVIGTVSGTSISFGTPVVFESGAYTSYIRASYDTAANKTLFVYSSSGNKAVVGTVSGTSISFGSKLTSGLEGAENLIYDESASKHVLVNASSQVLTVSGTSVSAGTAVEIREGGESGNKFGGVYDPTTGKIVFAYVNGSKVGKTVNATVSGTTLTFGSYLQFDTAVGSVNPSLAADTVNDKVLIIYRDENDSDKQAGVVKTIAGTLSPNLTSENYIGMSGGVVKTLSQSEAIGTESTFETGAVYESCSGYHVAEKKTLLMFRDASDSNKIKGRLVTTTGTTLSYGSIVELTGQVGGPGSVVYDSVNEKLVVIFRGNTNYTYAVVATISGSSLTFGTPVVFNSATSYVYEGVYDSTSGKIVVLYSAASVSYLKVGTVSGTSISFGSATSLGSGSGMYSGKLAYDPVNNKTIYVQVNDINSDGIAYVGTVSGTSISVGSPTTFNSNLASIYGAFYDAPSGKIGVIVQTGPGPGEGYVGTVSGTSISFGSGVQFQSGISQGTTGYDSRVNKFTVACRSINSPYPGLLRLGTISGNTFSFASPVTFNSGETSPHSVGFDSDQGTSIISFMDGGDGDVGKAIGFQASGSYVVTSEVADGDKAEINIKGAVDENQSGLTAGQSYYVQIDGTLGTTPADPSVFAGTAVAATKLIVKG